MKVEVIYNYMGILPSKAGSERMFCVDMFNVNNIHRFKWIELEFITVCFVWCFGNVSHVIIVIIMCDFLQQTDWK